MTKVCRYESDVQFTYAEMVAYCVVVVVPARVRKPKDNGEVEVCVGCE